MKEDYAVHGLGWDLRCIFAYLLSKLYWKHRHAVCGIFQNHGFIVFFTDRGRKPQTPATLHAL